MRCVAVCSWKTFHCGTTDTSRAAGSKCRWPPLTVCQAVSQCTVSPLIVHLAPLLFSQCVFVESVWQLTDTKQSDNRRHISIKSLNGCSLTEMLLYCHGSVVCSIWHLVTGTRILHIAIWSTVACHFLDWHQHWRTKLFRVAISNRFIIKVHFSKQLILVAFLSSLARVAPLWIATIWPPLLALYSPTDTDNVTSILLTLVWLRLMPIQTLFTVTSTGTICAFDKFQGVGL